MPVDNTKHDEVRKIILSLLVARPNAMPVAILDRDYYEAEGERIPYRKFGYNDIVEFLKSMPEHFFIEWSNGCYYVRGIASEKSKHVSSLVARQKSDLRSKRVPRVRHMHRPPYLARQPIRIPAEQLLFLTQYVKNNPNGVSMESVLSLIQKQLPHITLSVNDIRLQLRELSHQLYMTYDMIYPVRTNEAMGAINNHQAYNQVHSQESQSSIPVSMSQNVSRPSTTTETVYVGGDEGSECLDDLDSESDYMPAGCISRNHRKQPKISERLAANFEQYSNCEQNATFNKDNNDFDLDNYFKVNNNKKTIPPPNPLNSIDISSLVPDRTKLRLEQLMRKHPDGIWCAELPEKFLEEYKVHFNYTDLGVNSVREYVSYLPSIFFMTRTDTSDDFILYSADKRPIIPDKGISRTEPVEIKPASREQHNEHNVVRTRYDNDNAPIPSEASPTITKKFAPDDVMNYDDNVDKILVTELQSRNYLEVYIVELFNPNFFWIHLRENKKRFEMLMDELDNFYYSNRGKYTIPKIALKKGLNCACVYSNRWHRGVIKTVKPDFKVTVMFYDYGTLKTYAAEDVYYLHKQFAFLPMQAIPCGLNVVPCVGDRWKKSVIDKLIDKIGENLLAATIISIDPPNNSMMVILTDTSEDEDVRINDWLVKEKLARYGKMVRMCDNFCNTCSNSECNCIMQSPTSVEISDIGRIISIDEARRDREQSMQRDEKAYKLSGAKDEDIGKANIKALHNVPSSKRVILQMLRDNIKSRDTKSFDAKSPDVKSLDTKSQSRNYSENEPRRSKKLVGLLERLKACNVTFDSNSSTCTSIGNEDFKDNTQLIDSDTKVNAGPQGSNEGLNMLRNIKSQDTKSSDVKSSNIKSFDTKSQLRNYSENEPRKSRKLDLLERLKACNVTSDSNSSTCTSIGSEDFKDNAQRINSDTKVNAKPQNSNRDLNYMNFITRDSDEDNETDFGTFRSLYGGHGFMEPFDWSMIKKDDKNPPRKIVTLHNNLDNLIKESKSDAVEDKSKLHNQRNESPTKLYFLNVTRKEEEYYLPERNIDYEDKNVSQSVARLRSRMEVHNNKYTTVIVTRDILEMLRDNIQIQDTQISDANTVSINGTIFSEKLAAQPILNGNDERCGTKADQKTENSRFALNFDYEGAKALSFSENYSIPFNTDDSQQNQPNTTAEGISKIELTLKHIQSMTYNNELDLDDLSRSRDSIESDTNSNKENDKLIESINRVSVIHESTSNDSSVSQERFIFNDCDIESDDDSEWEICVEPEDLAFFIAQSPNHIINNMDCQSLE